MKNSIQAREEPNYLTDAYKQTPGCEDKFLKVILRLLNKQCTTDLILTWLLKKNLEMFSSFAERIFLMF